MSKISYLLPIHQKLTYFWFADIFFGVIEFILFIASLATSDNKEHFIEKVNPPFPHKRNFILVTICITLFILNLGFVSINNSKVLNFVTGPIITPTPEPTMTVPTITVQPTKAVKPVPKAPLNPTSMDTQEWGKTVKLDEHTSVSKFAPDDHMSTVDELNQAMNQYRITHNLPTLSFDSLLCNMAQTRANQLQANGALDSHAGFNDLAHNQQSFNTLDEVIFGGVNKVSGVHIVEWGWDTSLTGHHEAISDPQWKEGCGGITGLFAVFIFGAR